MSEGHGSQEEQWDVAIGALITSGSIAKAAAKLDVTEKTLDRWLKLPEFVQRYRAQRRLVVEQSLAVLQSAMTAAVTTLLKLLSRDDEPNVQCRAAGLILQHGIGALSLLDLESRVAQLEAAAAAETGE